MGSTAGNLLLGIAARDRLGRPNNVSRGTWWRPPGVQELFHVERWQIIQHLVLPIPNNPLNMFFGKNSL